MKSIFSTKKESKKSENKSFLRLFKFGKVKKECEILIRKDTPIACQTQLADFSTVCGCGCCAVSIA